MAAGHEKGIGTIFWPMCVFSDCNCLVMVLQKIFVLGYDSWTEQTRERARPPQSPEHPRHAQVTEPSLKLLQHEDCDMQMSVYISPLSVELYNVLFSHYLKWYKKHVGVPAISDHSTTIANLFLMPLLPFTFLSSFGRMCMFSMRLLNVEH